MKTAICLSLVFMLGNTVAQAADHGCGPRPVSPQMFDPQSATRAEVMENKAAYEVYQAANTVYLDCIEAYAKSDTFAAQPQQDIEKQTSDLNVEIQAVMAEEQAFADQFNENAKTWVELQRAAKEAAASENEDEPNEN